jgi:hypothetical protein
MVYWFYIVEVALRNTLEVLYNDSALHSFQLKTIAEYCD